MQTHQSGFSYAYHIQSNFSFLGFSYMNYFNVILHRLHKTAFQYRSSGGKGYVGVVNNTLGNHIGVEKPAGTHTLLTKNTCHDE